ncbi:hypothetical protein KK083_31260 [Fulvivirgaceae bacterium PWU4]|uniref:Uncharacterized protein n=1 Tax=Chryseosolibacter histidini TaxID=2782349 RepID=A0AAP2DVD5_9BACT|nr:hypothetical protein [Chryseosolibacter histidini]MBT1701414.1 hypothetical protein [Chryseosolibacter histidini]
MTHNTRQPWLANPWQESVFILAPALLPVALVFAFQDYFTTHEVSTFWWVLLVLCIDVSHVYSTLFRLYWDRQTFNTYRRLLIVIPVTAFAVGLLLHYYDAMLFWRILAYVAVYHFVRQQYGFMRLYARKEPASKFNRIIDALAIYNATVYPLLYWHLHATDKLAWFVKGDFITLGLQNYDNVLIFIYTAIIVLYGVKEIRNSYRQGMVNIPKNLIVLGTYASWYVGIVSFQGDLIFTLLNVVAHGIPYMALIWIHGEKKTTLNFSFNLKGVTVFAGVLLLLAYVEENLWDSMVWKDHPEIFPLLAGLPSLESPLLLSAIVALLVLPQVTHYVLDGFIWRFSKDSQSRL